jgi:hypothetical protein
MREPAQLDLERELATPSSALLARLIYGRAVWWVQGEGAAVARAAMRCARSANTPAAAAYLSSPAAERTVPTVLRACGHAWFPQTQRRSARLAPRSTRLAPPHDTHFDTRFDTRFDIARRSARWSWARSAAGEDGGWAEYSVEVSRQLEAGWAGGETEVTIYPTATPAGRGAACESAPPCHLSTPSHWSACQISVWRESAHEYIHHFTTPAPTNNIWHAYRYL